MNQLTIKKGSKKGQKGSKKGQKTGFFHFFSRFLKKPCFFMFFYKIRYFCHSNDVQKNPKNGQKRAKNGQKWPKNRVFLEKNVNFFCSNPKITENQ